MNAQRTLAENEVTGNVLKNAETNLRNSASGYSITTPIPVLSQISASEQYAQRIRKLAFDMEYEVIDWHDELSRGRNPERRFTRDGFLHWAMPIEVPKSMEEILGPFPKRESEGEAVHWAGLAEERLDPTPRPERSDLGTNWSAFAKTPLEIEPGGFSLRLTNENEFVSYPFPFVEAGPGTLKVSLQVSRRLEDHELPTCLVQDKDGFAFQAVPTKIKRKRGSVFLEYDLSEDSHQFYGVGHQAGWCETYRRRCNRLGFSLFRRTPEPVTYHFRAIAFESAPWPEERLRILDFRAPSLEIPAYGTFEPRFFVDGLPPGNYFDPEVVRVACEVVEPSGTTNRVNGFLHQEFERRLEDGSEVLTAVGPLEWRVRYTPRKPGTYRYRIGVGTQDAESWSATYFFECLPAEHPGFVRVSKDAPRYFETERGEFFFPVGLNMHNPYDTRNVDAFGKAWEVKGNPGTFIYERIFKRLAEAGGNTATVWMSPWWVEFEWNASYSGCHGLTDYNLARAWQLDQVMTFARANGIRINLSLENHGKFSELADAQWDENPYNAVHGGPVDSSEAFFTSLEARAIYRKNLTTCWRAGGTIRRS